MESLREHNMQTDAERGRRLLDEYRAGGLAVVGVCDSLSALYQGHADELRLSASAREIRLDCEEFDVVRAKAHGVPAQPISGARKPHLVAADLNRGARAPDGRAGHLCRGHGAAGLHR